MLGYVVAEKAELKMREYEVYNAYYCGLCKSIGRRLGQVPRLMLSYDFAFVALLLASLEEEEDDIVWEHCVLHHVKKKSVIKNNRAVDYAADLMLISVYYNLIDDVNDEKKLSSRALAALFHKNHKKLSKQYCTICESIESQLSILSDLEKNGCTSLDETGETCAVIMGEILAGGISPETKDAGRKAKALYHLGRFMGKWVYLADAWDDIEKDIENHSYNPIVSRFRYEQGKPTAEFRNEIRQQVENLLLSCLSEISKACDLLELKKNKGIVENIIYFGLLRKTEQLIRKGTEENERSI